MNFLLIEKVKRVKVFNDKTSEMCPFFVKLIAEGIVTQTTIAKKDLSPCVLCLKKSRFHWVTL